MFQEALQITEVTQIWLVLLSLQNRKAYWVETEKWDVWLGRC